MEFSQTAESIFRRAEQGKAGSFAVAWQQGYPGCVRCGGIAGKIVAASGLFFEAKNILFRLGTEGDQGRDLFLLTDNKSGTGRFALIVDGIEQYNSQDPAIAAHFAIIAEQRSGKPFAVVGVFGPNDNSGMVLCGSDRDFIDFAGSTVALLGEVCK